MNEKQKEAFLKMAEKNLSGARGGDQQPSTARGMEMVYDIPVTVTAVLGKTTLTIHQLLAMNEGSVLDLDKQVGDSVDIYVNNKMIAKGELVAQGDKLGITLTEILKV